jgi:uncharacterized protein (UPF0332 family)
MLFLSEDAARAAYLASFHVAHAYIFERMGKSHDGVQTEFFKLSKDDGRMDAVLRKRRAAAPEVTAVI